MAFSLVELVYILISIQSLLLAIFIFNYRKGKKNTNHFLGSFFLTLLFSISYSILYQKNLIWKGINFECSLMMLYGVSILYYIKSISFKGFKLKFTDLYHVFPHFIILIWLLSFYIFEEELIESFFNGTLSPKKFTCVFTGLFARIHFGIYLIWSFLVLRKFQKVSLNTQSAENRINIKWLTFMILSGLMITFTSAIRFIIPLSEYPGLELPLFIIESILTLIFINSILYRTLQQPEKFMGLSEEEVKITTNNNTKYAFSNLTSEQIKSYHDQLLLLINSEKPYLNPNITLSEISKKLKIPSKHLSQVINEKLNQNFFEFINSYRIEEAKQLLINPENKGLRINEVMYESGFTSKSTFNNTFKKFTGYTPTQFKKEV